MKMPKEMKDKWLTALRSGDYEQAQGRLCVDGAYCCLGVLQKEVSGEVECRAPTEYYPTGFSMAMPSARWCADNGIQLDTGCVSGFVIADSHISKLVEMNDGPNFDEDGEDGQTAEDIAARKSFAEIADWIENNVEAV